MATHVSTGQILGVFSASAISVLALVALVLACRRHRGSESEKVVVEEEEVEVEEEEEGRGRAVLVTGCDSGFGHHLALRLDRRGYAVFAGCLAPEGGGARRLARAASGRLRVLRLDVTDDRDVRRAEDIVRSNLPEKGLWAVVNNAGITDWAETEWSTIDHYTKMADVNLFGCIRTTIAFLPLVRASKGRMVYVSSILAFFNCLNMGAYSVSKRGLEAFADCLRVEMASFGVKVSIIQPGNFGRATDILKTKTSSDIWEALSPERRRTFDREYVELAARYFSSVSRSGFGEVGPVVDAMLDAVASPRPKHRYLLVSRAHALFLGCYRLLPTRVADAVLALSPMYARRKEMLYAQR